ncbi:hypothetical protein BVY04_04265 [bacterium M21]|nr:hypothetical protein BVY04_04265 [bacterium M21]
MSMLSPEFDPFRKQALYDDLEIDAYADAETINARLEEVGKELEGLPDAERAKRSATFQEALKKLKNPRDRTLLNAMCLDKVNVNHLVNELTQRADNLDIKNLKMPPLDVSSIMFEGENEEIAKVDFQDVDTDPDLELDTHDVEQLLNDEPIYRHVTFDS